MRACSALMRPPRLAAAGQMARILALLAGLVGVDALATDYDGYFHFKAVSMDGTVSPLPGTWNSYVTPGDGALPLGYQQQDADLALAKHLCDEYDSCKWFNGDAGSYPGSIGWWKTDATQDTYIKNTTGTVVPGYLQQNSYLHLSVGLDIWCDKIAGPWQLPPDAVKAQCDQLATCDGFTVMNDLSSGFLCAFNMSLPGRETFIKLPVARVGRASM